MSRRRIAVEIHGAVQGVGFRPFVYRLATELGLAGWVLNDARGVFIEVEGPTTPVESFVHRLQTELPRVAHIDTIDIEDQAPIDETAFVIRHSEETGTKTAVILPDLTTCEDCLEEVLDATDRRFGYPFTNCTNCGPRFTIIRDLPYDRPNTSMASFTMCSACQAEYDDPSDRRFHAQPNACAECGPSLVFLRGEQATQGNNGAIAEAADLLRSGGILAVKGLGGFQLLVDATNEGAVCELRRRKQRPTKPLAVMASSLEQARELVVIDDIASDVLTGPQGPIVLLGRRDDSGLARSVAPGNPDIGVMLPTTPLHHILMASVGIPLVATSGNLSDEPICIDNDEAQERLDGIADAFLMHDRPIVRHVDDSVTWVVDGESRVLRRARGYAPLPTPTIDAGSTVLAVGAHLKNTITVTVGDRAITSQHIGDLSTVEAHEAFRTVIADLTRMYDLTPGVIAHDLHPDYLSTSHARDLAELSDAQLEGVQHHHAHLASCLVDNDFTAEALGVCWDGTGFGGDGTVWGGEFLLGSTSHAARVGHLRPFRLPGGDAAVREPRRSAAGLLHEIGIPFLGSKAAASLTTQEAGVIEAMINKGLNSPITTSAGRLFDGVSAIAGLSGVATFEGEGAMALEHVAAGGDASSYPFSIVDGVVDWGPMVESIMHGDDAADTVGARFHLTLAAMIVEMAMGVGVEHVALTGGCFQNRKLTMYAARALREAGFTPLLHRRVPPNDGGISVGQIAVAAARLTS